MTPIKPVNEMTNAEFVEFIVSFGMKGWIPLETYIQLFPSETRVTVESRIKRKYWTRGVHYTYPPGARMWVNTIAIGEWAQAQADADRGQ